MQADPEPTSEPPGDADAQDRPGQRPPERTADADEPGENVEPEELVTEPGDAEEIG
jgi:hypothetical protein